MRHNGRPAVLVSTLPPDQVNLRPGEPVAVACPICGKWRHVRRHMLWPHRAHDGKTRCPGSGQRVRLDLTPAQWLVRLETARRSLRRTRSLQRDIQAALTEEHARQRAGSGRAA